MATGLLSPLISCQPSGLLGAETGTGSYNRLFAGESANVCVCSQMSGLEYEPREELILTDELPLMDSLPPQ